MQIIHSLKEKENIEVFEQGEFLRAPWLRFESEENTVSVFWYSPEKFENFVTLLNEFLKEQKQNDSGKETETEPNFNHLIYVKRNSCSWRILKEIYIEEIL